MPGQRCMAPQLHAPAAMHGAPAACSGSAAWRPGYAAYAAPPPRRPGLAPLLGLLVARGRRAAEIAARQAFVIAATGWWREGAYTIVVNLVAAPPPSPPPLSLSAVLSLAINISSLPFSDSGSTVGAQTAYGSEYGNGAGLYALRCPADAAATVVVRLVGDYILHRPLQKHLTFGRCRGRT